LLRDLRALLAERPQHRVQAALMSGVGGPLSTARSRAVDDERDGFAALLGAFGRQIDRDARAGHVTVEAAELIRRRIGTMVEHVGLGLHLTNGSDRP
jgi:hypothetical protein